MKRETTDEILSRMRGMVKPGETITNTYELLNGLADDIKAAEKREAEQIERIVRDAIIDYQDMYAYAPNNEAEEELVERAARANNWLVRHGYEPESVNFGKEESPCL